MRTRRETFRAPPLDGTGLRSRCQYFCTGHCRAVRLL